jgi:hypothetical protein
VTCPAFRFLGPKNTFTFLPAKFFR